MSILGQDEADQYVQDRVDSGDWWILVGSSPLNRAVEERFYSGDANDDFQIMLGPPAGPFRQIFPDTRLLPLVFAHKRRMSDTQFSRLLSDIGAQVSPEELERQDIVFPVAAS